MEAVIFIGIQATGKSTFYKERFFNTHMRINGDMLKTQHREKLLLQACLEAKQPFVIDKTNPTVADREKYMELSKSYHFKVIGYYFQSVIDKCMERNNSRPQNQVIPAAGILNAYKKLQLPSFEEGFDQLYYVKIDDAGKFIVEEWKNEV